jgi:DNA-binding NtrC family response regulator
VTAPPKPVRATAEPPRVLVIDDEPHFGTLMVRLLEGHDVVALTSAREALDLIAAGEERFDVVLCDLNMPQMSGMDFVECLRSMAPELVDRVIIITGGAFTPRATAFLEQTVLPKLEKPFDLPALRAVVREQLARRAGGS